MAQGAGRDLRIQVIADFATTPASTGSRDDARMVAAQLGRTPMGTWSVAARCEYGRPTVVLTHPRLPDGSPFPTLYWLTCPWLTSQAGRLESAGGTAAWAARLAAEPQLAEALLAADAEYRRRRAAAAGGIDPTPSRGIAGQADPTATKCLHAHVANALAGIHDPIGTEVLGSLDETTCPDDACASISEVSP
ncbi:MAG: DUF501 domain-containing protein [Coriobacteriia bacterium]